MIRPPFSPGARSGKTGTGLLLAAEAGEALVELGDLAALVVEAGGAAGPGRMRGRIDVEHHGVTRLAPGRPGRIDVPVGHLELDLVVDGMKVGHHCCFSLSFGQPETRKFLISEAV